MKEIKGNAFELFKDYDILCVTTNGFVKSNGECVMGRGIAKQIADRYRHIPGVLGNYIKEGGNNIHFLDTIPDINGDCIDLYSFPVKHNWWEKADIDLIVRSCHQLNALVGEKQVLLPRPGCDNGKLDWNEVKSIISPILNPNITIISYGR